MGGDGMTEKQRKIKQSEYSRRYYQRNRERILEKARAYRQAHQEAYRAYMREYMKAYRKIKNTAQAAATAKRGKTKKSIENIPQKGSVCKHDGME